MSIGVVNLLEAIQVHLKEPSVDPIVFLKNILEGAEIDQPS